MTRTKQASLCLLQVTSRILNQPKLTLSIKHRLRSDGAGSPLCRITSAVGCFEKEGKLTGNESYLNLSHSLINTTAPGVILCDKTGSSGVILLQTQSYLIQKSSRNFFGTYRFFSCNFTT